MRDFESGPSAFAGDVRCLRFSLHAGSAASSHIELGARILYDHPGCAMWVTMPHTAGKAAAVYWGQPQRSQPDEAIPTIKMGGGEAPVVPARREFKHLGSVLSKNFDGSVTIMARIRSARIAFANLQKAISVLGELRLSRLLPSHFNLKPEFKLVCRFFCVDPEGPRDVGL